MGQSRGSYRYLLFIATFIVTFVATWLGLQLGYGFLVLFVIAGSAVFLIFISLMIRPGVRSDRARTHLRPADPGFTSYVMAPTEVYPGYCWQCGHRVKADSIVCLRCGATHVHRLASPTDQASESAPWEVAKPNFSGGMTRWDSAPGTPLPPAAGPWQQPGAPAPPMQPIQPIQPRTPAQRVAPRYRPGAPPPWVQQRQPAPAPEPARRRRRK